MSDAENNRTIIPRKPSEAVAFFDAHIPVWEAQHARIGLQEQTVASIKTANNALKAALATQEAAKSAAKAATTGMHNANRTLREVGQDGVRAIKDFALSTNDPSVYEIAQIPPPAAPKPQAPPSQPTDFKVELTSTGGIRISWKSTGSSGGFFAVSRKLAGENAFDLIGNSGRKFYVDNTLPVGTSGATYIVQGWRGDVAGTASQQLTIQFGVGGGGLATVKMAA
jgi:hypothetical protein